MDKSADRQTDNNNSDGNDDRHRTDRKMETHMDRWADGQTGRRTHDIFQRHVPMTGREMR